MGQIRGRSGAKKEKELVKALTKDMKGKQIDPRTGKVVTKRPAPKPKAPPKPRNKRTGPDYLDR